MVCPLWPFTFIRGAALSLLNKRESTSPSESGLSEPGSVAPPSSHCTVGCHTNCRGGVWSLSGSSSQGAAATSLPPLAALALFALSDLFQWQQRDSIRSPLSPVARSHSLTIYPSRCNMYPHFDSNASNAGTIGLTLSRVHK